MTGRNEERLVEGSVLLRFQPDWAINCFEKNLNIGRSGDFSAGVFITRLDSKPQSLRNQEFGFSLLSSILFFQIHEP